MRFVSITTTALRSIVFTCLIGLIGGAAQAGSGTDGRSASASLIEQHALAQQGLSIGLATALFELQTNGFAVSGKVDVCHHKMPVSGTTGGYQILQKTIGDTKSKVTLEIYYDGDCQNRYLHAKYVAEKHPHKLLTATVAATLYGVTGKVLGGLTLDTSTKVSDTVQDTATGTFTPSHGGPVQLGYECSYSLVNGPIGKVPCTVGVAQSFASTGNDIASVTPITFKVDSAGLKATLVTKNAQLASGPSGTLGISAPTRDSLAITGAAATIGTASGTGMLTEFSPFPKGPSSWNSSDSANDTKFAIALASGASMFKGTLKTIASKATLAKVTVDLSGTGSIVYSDNSKAAITSWTVAN
jgi:molybdopterin-binding protein